MPLQTGAAALESLGKAAVLLVPSFILTPLGYGWAIYVGADFLVGVCTGIPLFAFVFARRQLRKAKRMRPSDLVLDAKGFTIEGGPRDKFFVTWPEVKEVEFTHSHRMEEDPATVLELRLKNGRTFELAASDDENEVDALRDVQATLNASLREAPAPSELPPEVLRCASCQAAVTPLATPSAPCPFCGSAVETPPALREKVAAQQVMQSHDARAVDMVLQQRGAVSVANLSKWGAIAQLAAWPIFGAAMIWNVIRGGASWSSAWPLLLFVFACILGFFAVLRSALVERQTLRVLTLRFAAKSDGKGHQCRSCSAPLPAKAAHSLVRCVYCDAPNVLAGDFSTQARAVEGEKQSLEDALKRREVERNRWRFAQVTGLVLLGVSVVSLVAGLVR